MLKSCILGCGGRSRGHLRAYEFVENGQMAAICDMDEERLQERADEFGLETRYTNYQEMLEKEKPDVLHIVTAPIWRVDVMSIAAEFEVPVVIVEKPIGLEGGDYRQIKNLHESAKTRFVVNTQLHFHPRNMQLKQDVADGRIGEVRQIDASARSTVVDQGVHVLELAQSYNGFSKPVRVFGNVSGLGTLPDKRQPSPDMAASIVEFENGVRCQLMCGDTAPIVQPEGGKCSLKRISVYGTRGFVQWTMHGWERSTVEEGHESGTHSYGEEDVRGQAALTDAAFAWSEDESRPHPTRLDNALPKFNTILGMYVSALTNKPIDLPFDPPDGILDDLRERFKED